MFLSILIFIDILFLATGQIDLNSPTSVITDAILEPTLFKSTVFFAMFLGIVGVAGLIATSGVTTGILANATNVLAFAAMAIAMGALLGDYITVYLVLNAHNQVLSKFIMAPVIMMFAVTVAEWLRGKD